MARAWPSCARTGPRSGAGPGPTGATRRPTIRECSWASAIRPRYPEFGSSGQAVASRNLTPWPSIGTRRSRRAPEMQNDTCRVHESRASRRVLCALFVVTTLCTACTSRPALQPVLLPDLSRASKPVQDQLRERYGSLTLKMENAATPTAELGNEYGEIGKLLMAAEYRDAAEPCFLNAQALVPSDARWPYYLAHLYRQRSEPEKSAMFFEKALQLRPDHVAALVWLGDLDLLLGRPDA